MAKYCIKYNDFQAQANSLRNISKDILKLEDRLISIANSMDGRDSNMASLKRQVRSSGRNIPELFFRVDSMVSSIVEITNIYQQAEKECYTILDDKSIFHDLITANNLLKMISEAGFLGSVLSFPFNPLANWIDKGLFNFTTETGALGVAESAKDVYSLLKGLLKWKESNEGLKKLARILPEQAKKTAFKRLIGLNDAMGGAASKAGKWGTKFTNNFNKLKADELAEYNLKNGAKAAFKWVGISLDGIVNAFENYNEAKSGEISTERAVAETVLETTVDFSKDILIGAAVTAGIAATFTSAPVVVAGLVSCGINITVDWAFEKVTGKDMTETVSDTVLDIVEETGKAIDKGKNFIKDAFNHAVNCFTNPRGPTKGIWLPILGL